MNILLGLLLWMAILLPFLLLAYAIFLLRENAPLKYAGIYRLAGVYALAFLGIAALYYFLPSAFADKTKHMAEGDEEGTYREAYSGDTLTLKATAFVWKKAGKPEPVSGSYSLQNLANGTSPENYRQYNGLVNPNASCLYRLLKHFNTLPKEAPPQIAFSYQEPFKETAATRSPKKKTKKNAVSATAYDNMNERYAVKNYGDTLLLSSFSHSLTLVRIR